MARGAGNENAREVRARGGQRPVPHGGVQGRDGVVVKALARRNWDEVMAAVFAPAFPLTVGGLSPLAGRQRPVTIRHQKQSRMVCTKPFADPTPPRGCTRLQTEGLCCCAEPLGLRPDVAQGWRRQCRRDLLFLATLFASPIHPSTALWRTVAWQDCQSRAAARARWCMCRTKALQVGPATSAAGF